MVSNTLRLLCLFLASWCWVSPALAQIESLMELHEEEVCSYFGENVPPRITLFTADAEAESVIKTIIRATGLVPNFVLRAGGVATAAAVIREEKRYIIYSQQFMHNITQKTGNPWPAISVLAHEIGHHLNGHTLMTDPEMRPRLELEADYYSGFVLQRMGASLEEARKAIEIFGSPVSSPSHPAKYDRLAAITNGWVASCNADAGCRQLLRRPPAPVAAQPAPQPRVAPPVARPRPAPSGGRPAPNPACELGDEECDELMANACLPGDPGCSRRTAPGARPYMPEASGGPVGRLLGSGQLTRPCGCWNGSNSLPPSQVSDARCQSGVARLYQCPGEASCPGRSNRPFAYVCS